MKWKVERTSRDGVEILRADNGLEYFEAPTAALLIGLISAATALPLTRWKVDPAEMLRLGAEIERVWQGRT